MAFVAYSCASDHGSVPDHATGADAGDVGAGDHSDAADSLIQECHWPSNLAALDSTTREVCRAARAFLNCKTNGVGIPCATDDFSKCGSTSSGEVPFENCSNTCKGDEYAALCGGVGPGPVPDPPAGCRFAFANPGGIATYCCPCE
jgi:hypothetical protein